MKEIKEEQNEKEESPIFCQIKKEQIENKDSYVFCEVKTEKIEKLDGESSMEEDPLKISEQNDLKTSLKMHKDKNKSFKCDVCGLSCGQRII